VRQVTALHIPRPGIRSGSSRVRGFEGFEGWCVQLRCEGATVHRRTVEPSNPRTLWAPTVAPSHPRTVARGFGAMRIVPAACAAAGDAIGVDTDMAIPSPPDPKALCPFCERAGMVGHEREIKGAHAVTVFRCHHCNRSWEVPDDPRHSSPYAEVDGARVHLRRRPAGFEGSRVRRREGWCLAGAMVRQCTVEPLAPSAHQPSHRRTPEPSNPLS
jgi:hypothetical protein